MSNIRELIDTIKEENLENRQIALTIDAVNQGTQLIWLETIHMTLSQLRDGFYQYMEDERERFILEQRDLKAARRAEAERLKEAQAKGFAPTEPDDEQQTSPAAPSGDGGGGLFAGLGITGLLTGIGAAISGYTVGLINNLIKIITFGKYDPKLLDGITKAVKAIPNAIKGFALASIMQIQLFLDGLPKPSMPQGLVNAGKAITTFFTENKIGQVLAKVGNVLKTIGASIASVFDMRPILDAVKTLGGGQGGGILSKIGNFFGRLGTMFGTVFTVASKIAVPITAIIAAVKGIFSSFGEFSDEMGFFEKYLIVVKNIAKELISGFITMPLELIKDFISWTAGKLGFEGVEKFLDSFDIDAKFREIFDGFIEGISDVLNRISDFVYAGLRKLGIGDVDPEAEARIAQREVDDARESLAEAETRVQEAQAAVDAAPEGSREQARAQSELNLAVSQRNARAEDVQEAEVRSQEAQVYAQTAMDEDTQASSLQAAEDSGLYDPRGFGNSEVDKDVLAQTTDVNQLKAIINDQDISTEDKRLVLNRIEELSADQNVQPRTGIKRGMEIGGPPVELSERGQAAVEAFEGDGVPDYNPETGRRGAEIGAPEKKVAGIVVERNGQPVPLTPEQVERVQFANEMATITSESNQPYDVSVNPIVAANQTATGDQISTVSNQTATGDQISTVASAPTSVDLSGIDFSQASSSQEVRQLVKDAGGDRSMQNSARMLYDAGINSQLIQTAVGTGVEVSKSTLGRPETISQLIQGGMERSEVYRLARDMGVQDPNTVVDMGVNMAMRAVPQPTATPADEVQPQPTAAVLEPRVEPLSDLTNVTNINQATTAMQSALASIIPSEAGDLNIPGQEGIDEALSPAGIMGAGLGAVVDGVKNLTSLPVGQASQEVAAAKDKPPVVAMGGSTTSIQNNVSSPNVHNYGSMSARSNDLSAQRLKDHMMA